jgi:hypothetical protein
MSGHRITRYAALSTRIRFDNAGVHGKAFALDYLQTPANGRFLPLMTGKNRPKSACHHPLAP